LAFFCRLRQTQKDTKAVLVIYYRCASPRKPFFASALHFLSLWLYILLIRKREGEINEVIGCERARALQV
jgi:hypothetical protein